MTFNGVHNVCSKKQHRFTSLNLFVPRTWLDNHPNNRLRCNWSRYFRSNRSAYRRYDNDGRFSGIVAIGRFAMTHWNKHARDRQTRLQAASVYASGKLVEAPNATALLEAVLRPGDRLCLEGDNQILS